MTLENKKVHISLWYSFFLNMVFNSFLSPNTFIYVLEIHICLRNLKWSYLSYKWHFFFFPKEIMATKSFTSKYFISFPLRAMLVQNIIEILSGVTNWWYWTMVSSQSERTTNIPLSYQRHGKEMTTHACFVVYEENEGLKARFHGDLETSIILLW